MRRMFKTNNVYSISRQPTHTWRDSLRSGMQNALLVIIALGFALLISCASVYVIVRTARFAWLGY